MVYIVLHHKYVVIVVCYILGLLSSLQASGRWPLATGQNGEARSQGPDTRHLKPLSMKKKIDKLNPCFENYLRDYTLGGELMSAVIHAKY